MSRMANRPTLSEMTLVFFARQPEEELTTLDVQLKFAPEVKTGAIRCALERLVVVGFLEKLGGRRGCMEPNVYSAGPRITGVPR